MFADRTQWDLTPNRLARRRAQLRRKGVPLLDLTESNPTRCRFDYPADWLAPLSEASSLAYEPAPLGLPEARQALSSLYADAGAWIPPERIGLTASTSEAYGFLLRLLCNPGDSVLIPQPSYPLFEHLWGLHDVLPRRYALCYRPGPNGAGERWRLDREALEAAADSRSRAVVLVEPNNPTGSFLDSEEWGWVMDLCRRSRLALIRDEVFSDYRYAPADPAGSRFRAAPAGLLSFTLGGLSKSLGLPQMKLGWFAASGPEPLLQEALARLELIADTALSVNTPVQKALPGWLAQRRAIQSQILGRLLENRRFLQERLQGAPVRLLESDGGWSALLRVPGLVEEEEFLLGLMERRHLVAYPGYFFDFEEPGFLVVSLLPPPERFQEGILRLLEEAARCTISG